MGGCVPRYRVFIVDLGGVVWRNYVPIGENVGVLRRLQERGAVLVALTNNSTRTREYYQGRLAEIGLDIPLEHIVTSGYAAAVYLSGRMPGARVYVVGEEGLREELRRLGLVVLGRCGRADAVVVGLDRRLSYGKIACASMLARRGAFFLATNTDPTRPLPGGGEAPSAGSMVAAVAVAAGRGPDFIAGKPNPWVVRLVLDRLGVGVEEALIIGDRVETDVALGLRAGIDTLLIDTGVVNRGSLIPTYHASSLREAEGWLYAC